MIDPKTQIAFAEFLVHLWRKIDAEDQMFHYRSLKSINPNREPLPREHPVILEVDTGRKYWRLWRIGKGTHYAQKSAYCFVDQTNGNILMPATWKKPAKHARGNIFDMDNGIENCGLFGVAYMDEIKAKEAHGC